MISPTRNHKDVALLPIEANASDDSGAPSLNHVINGAIYLPVCFGVHAGADHLNPAGHRIHDRTACVRIRIFECNIVKRTRSDPGQIVQRALGHLPFVNGKRRITHSGLLPSRPQLADSILQYGLVNNSRHLLDVLGRMLEKWSIEIIIQRHIESVHPHGRLIALATVIVPMPRWVDGEIAALEIDFVALHGGVGALAVDHETNRLRGVAMRGSDFPGIEPLHGGPKSVCGVGSPSQSRIRQAHGPAITAASERHEFAGAAGKIR